MFSRKRAGGKIVHYASFMYQGVQRTELVGTDKREAERVEAQRKREIREGTYTPGQRTGAISAAEYSKSWGSARKNRTANDDRQRLRDYFVRHVGPKIRMHEFGEPEALRFVRWLAELVAKGEIAARTGRHIRGVVRTMFRDAKLEGVVAVDPLAGLPRKLLPKPPRRARNVYTCEEVARLLHDERIPLTSRALVALMLYMGVREGEACGRRWRDWDRGVTPLGSMNVATQYNDEPLKTDNARKVPVHPDLARLLASWWDGGFELTFRRRPTPDDFIVPNRHPRTDGGGAHTKSSAYKAMGRACEVAEVRFEGCHLTRHTMITWARRGGARSDVLERVTHNAAGAIIDQYTHFDWAPLCEAVACLDYGGKAKPAREADAAAAGTPAALAVPEAPAARAVPPVHVAFHVMQPRRGQKHGAFGWRRRESNSSGNFNKALEFRVVSLSDEFDPVVHRVSMNTSSCERVRRGLGT
jgi:integrase